MPCEIAAIWTHVLCTLHNHAQVYSEHFFEATYLGCMSCLVQFSSVQDGIYALGKAHMHFSVSQKFQERRLSNGSAVRLTDDGSLSSFKEDRRCVCVFARHGILTLCQSIEA